ncbi:MAG: UDP-N-acetylmuramoyl-L-alanine--D-glutamate ligase [Burkholderiaceae bacterium]
MKYNGKHVLVLGLGETGLAMALWLLRCGARLRVADTRTAPERLSQLRQAAPEVEFVAGAFGTALLDDIDFVAVSPGLAPGRELAPLLPAAAERGIPLWSEIELFAQALAALRAERGYAPQVLAITGTNGKTTVTSLVGLLCARAGRTVQLAGNISPAALDVLRDALEQDALPQVWVLELSSFQLHFTYSLAADAATILNVSQDHLDWHGDMAAYVADKQRIFAPTTIAVVNRADAVSTEGMPTVAGRRSFGADAPRQDGCFGLIDDSGMQWLATAVAADEGGGRRGRKELFPAPVTIKRLMPAAALKIRGRHNALNALAALTLCSAIDLPLAPLLHGLREYAGEPHRVERVATIGGVDYYDDSKGTNVGATVAALNGLGAELGAGRRLLLIAGGDGKGQDFSPLAEPLTRCARAVFLIGKDGPTIRAAVSGAGVELVDCTSLEQAVEQAAAAAAGGDAVLLSPACASLDMFRNYKHRADVFVAAVQEIGMARGEVPI